MTSIWRKLTIEVGSMVERISSWEVGGITQTSDCQAKEDGGNKPLDIPVV